MIKNIQPIFASALLISLVACGTTSTTPNNPTSTTPPADTQTTTETTPSPETATETIVFKEPMPNKLLGRFDAVNNNSQTTQTIDPSQPLTLSGWALSSDLAMAADSVLITYGDTNTVATTVPISVDRPDVAKVLKNPNLSKSGWIAKIDPATLNLTGEATTIRAWSYNSQTKEAYPLSNSFAISK
jgi:hypothetical protein